MSYGFIDTTPQTGRTPALLSLQTVFNGNNLDQLLTDTNGSFTTIAVNGRGNMKKRIRVNEIAGVHGVKELDGATYEPREIVVKYRLKDKTNEGFINRLTRLNSLLRGSKLVLSFTDENKTFKATVQANELDDEESNDLTGEILFFCSDPFKYGPVQDVPSGTVNNIGTELTPPIITANFTGAAEEYKIENNEGKFVRVIYSFTAGDVLEIDLGKRKVTINGKVQMATYDWQSKPFSLLVGSNTLTVTPAGVANTRIKYNPRWY